MSLSGQLDLNLNEEKRFGFLSFSVKDAPPDNYQLTAWITEDADKKKYTEWTCDVMISKSCATCRRSCESKYQRQVTLRNDALSSTFPLRSIRTSFEMRRFSCYHSDFKFLLFVFLRADDASPKCSPGSKQEDKKFRFTDEAEAKKLNANLKIRFEDSDEPIFVNRELLGVYSNVFRVMFAGDFKESNAEEIKLELNREDFLSFLECLYLPPAPINWQNFKTVAMIADRYDCPYLIHNCKKFAEEEAKTVSIVEDCKVLIEVAERLGWEWIIAAAVRVNFIADLLEYEWMMARKKTTVKILFICMYDLIPCAAFGRCPMRVSTSETTTTRFTDEDEAKKLNANCKIYFEDSGKPVFVNRELLTVYSNVFRSMFEGDFKEKNDVKLEVKREDFLSFLDCLYYPTAQLTTHNFKAVLFTAKRYDCPQLFDNCKRFAETVIGDNTLSVEEYMDYVEVAEHLGWNELTIIDSMKKLGVTIFMKLLNSDWITQRIPSTQRALYVGLKEVVMAHVK